MTYFVTTQYIKNNTNVGSSIDENLIAPLVKTAAEMWVRSILGNHFFEDLLSKFNNQTLDPVEIDLVSDYIKPAIAWKVAADVTANASLLLRNKGVQTQSGDFSAAADFKSMAFVQRTSFEKGTFYEGLLFNYLKENGDIFPEFKSDSNTDSTVRKSSCGDTDYRNNIMFI